MFALQLWPRRREYSRLVKLVPQFSKLRDFNICGLSLRGEERNQHESEHLLAIFLLGPQPVIWSILKVTLQEEHCKYHATKVGQESL